MQIVFKYGLGVLTAFLGIGLAQGSPAVPVLLTTDALSVPAPSFSGPSGTTIATYASSGPSETIELWSNGKYLQTLTLFPVLDSSHKRLSSATYVQHGKWKLIGVPPGTPFGDGLPQTAQIVLTDTLVPTALRETSARTRHANRTLSASVFQRAIPPPAKPTPAIVVKPSSPLPQGQG